MSDEPQGPAGKRVAVPPPPPPPPPLPPAPSPTGTSTALAKPSRPRHLITLVVAAAVVVIVVAVSVIAHYALSSGRPTTLTLLFESGQFRQAHMTLHSTGSIDTGTTPMATNVQMSSDLQFVVQRLDPSGAATINVAQTNITMSASGIHLSPGVPTGATLKIAPDGALIESVGAPLVGGAAAESEFAASNLSAILPDGSARPGDSWTKYINETIMHNQLGFQTTSTYVRNEDVGPVTAAVVETRATIPFDVKVPVGDLGDPGGVEPSATSLTDTYSYSGTMTTDTTSWIDPVGHRLLKTSITVRSNLGVSAKDALTGNPQGYVVKGTVVLTITFP